MSLRWLEHKEQSLDGPGIWWGGGGCAQRVNPMTGMLSGRRSQGPGLSGCSPGIRPALFENLVLRPLGRGGKTFLELQRMWSNLGQGPNPNSAAVVLEQQN